MSKARDLKLQQAGGCPNYQPCPICFSCENKAVHLYEACQTCEVPIDHHNHVGKSWMIKRSNFELNISEETRQDFAALAGDAVQPD